MLCSLSTNHLAILLHTLIHVQIIIQNELNFSFEYIYFMSENNYYLVKNWSHIEAIQQQSRIGGKMTEIYKYHEWMNLWILRYA